ncbi:MAG: hydrogenase maturation peptidase HycI [Candidatus Aureabacteria bacterium]|nr:hydrogenase maturation peptidase HycI [Candidatus Auribacterota bacterium]
MRLPDLSFYLDGGCLVILTVGNTLRSDDGAGPYMASKLHSASNVKIIDGGMHPENSIEQITAWKPSIILIIDAADFGGGAGEVRIIESEAIPENSLSTHAISLKVIAKILNDDIGAKIIFIGIQPKDVSFGEGLSPEVKTASDELVEWMNRQLLTKKERDMNHA